MEETESRGSILQSPDFFREEKEELKNHFFDQFVILILATICSQGVHRKSVRESGMFLTQELRPPHDPHPEGNHSGRVEPQHFSYCN